MHPITQAVLDKALSLGGLAATEQHDAGYTSSCVYGSPWHDRTPFTVVTVVFPQPIDFGLLTEAAGAKRCWTTRGGRTVAGIKIYDHATLTPKFGQSGTGITFVTASDRQNHGLHLTLMAEGVSEGMFG